MSLDLINALVAVMVLLRLIHMADRMNGVTRHTFRFAVAFLALCCLAYALWPLFGQWRDWMDTVFLCAVGVYVFSDMRMRCVTKEAI